MSDGGWEIRERHPLAPKVVDLVSVALAGAAAAIGALLVSGMWWLGLVTALSLFALAVGVRNLRLPDVLVLRIDESGIAIGRFGLMIPWASVRSASRVVHRRQGYLRVEVATPYKLVPMRSKRRRLVSSHVWSFNGQPINISASISVALDEIERQIRARMPRHPSK